MRKNRTMRTASVLCACALITSCFVGGTMAKYTSTASGSDTARAAKWSILVNGKDIATAENQQMDFDLFGTVAGDTGVHNNYIDGELDNDADVMDIDANTGDTIIAPGTAGQFNLEITNMSEVTADITIELAETQNTGNIPILYSFGDADSWHTYDDLVALVDSTYNGDWGSMLAALSNLGDMTALDRVQPAETVSIPVYWTWAYETEYDVEGEDYAQSDASDTAIGVAQASGTLQNVTITATVTATQVD